jgi:hypothetical protein
VIAEPSQASPVSAASAPASKKTAAATPQCRNRVWKRNLQVISSPFGLAEA